MNKHTHIAAVAASFLLAPVANLHAQSATPPGLRQVIGRVRPEMKAIFARQLAGPVACKPTEDEKLIAESFTSGTGANLYQDSTTFRYSGGRGSNLTSSLYSYAENFYPAGTLANTVDAQTTPTLLYDTARYFELSGSPIFQNILRTRTYDAANNVSSMVEQGYFGPAIAYQFYQALGYNAGNDLVSASHYEDTSMLLTGVYQLTRQLAAEYSAGLRNKDTIDYWNGADHSRGATGYTYDGAGRLTMQQTVYYDDITSLWQNSSRSTYTYDAAGRLTGSFSENWSGTAWMPSAQDTVAYTGASANYTFYENRYFLGGSDPHISDRHIATLNANGTWDSLYTYDGVTGTLVFSGAYGFQYNSNNHLTTYQGTVYDVSTGSWAPAAVRYYYEPNGSAGLADARKASAAFATLFPNPADDVVHVRIADPQGRVHVAITNAAGQMLYQQSGPAASGILLNTSGLPAGSYQVSVTMNGATQTLKLVKQ